MRQLTKAMEALGGPFLTFNTLTVDARKNLIELAGSADALASLASNFLTNFYSEAERQGYTLDNLTRVFQAANLTLPTTMEAYRALYEAQDLSTEAGRRNAVVLLQNADAFATLHDKAAALERASGTTDDAMAALRRSVERQAKILTTQRDAAQSLVDDLTSIFDILKGAVNELYSEVESVVQVQAAAGQSFIAQALANARATGALPDADELSQAINQARQGISGRQFVTQADADFERLVLAGRLNGLKEIAGTQLTNAEQQLQYLEDQLAALDQIVSYYEEQITTMREGNLSIVQAINNLTAALAVEKGLTPPKPTAADLGIPADRIRYDERGSWVGPMTPTLPMFTPEESAAFWGIPQMATGTNYVPKDMFAFLHKGESVVPAQYNYAAGGRAALADAALQALLDKMDVLIGATDVGNYELRRSAEALNGNPEQPMLVTTT